MRTKDDTCVQELSLFHYPISKPITQKIIPHSVVVGYTGGKELNPTYQSIKDSTEAVLIEYDPSLE